MLVLVVAILHRRNTRSFPRNPKHPLRTLRNVRRPPAAPPLSRRHQTCHFLKIETSVPAEGPAQGLDFARRCESPLRALQAQKYVHGSRMFGGFWTLFRNLPGLPRPSRRSRGPRREAPRQRRPREGGLSAELFICICLDYIVYLLYIYIYTHTYIYIYVKRERERE